MSAIRSLLEIVNPNPKRVAVWHGETLFELLATGDRVLVVPVEDLLVSYSGSKLARVVFIRHGEQELYGDFATEWVQEIGAKPVRPDPAKALKSAEVKAVHA